MYDWIGELVGRTGYLGIVLLMLAENLFPPIPSELVMPLAGYLAARDGLSLWGMAAAGTAGSLLGALAWYLAGSALGVSRLEEWAARHGRWLTIGPDDLGRSWTWFRRYGSSAVLLGRLVPTVRTLVSVPAGVVGMPLPRFLALSAIGTALWTTLLALGGYLLGERYGDIARYLNPVSTLVLALLLAWYLYRLATSGRRGS